MGSCKGNSEPHRHSKMELSMDQLAPLLALIQDKDLQERVEDVARGFFSNGTITVNIIPALLIAAAIGAFIKLGGAAFFLKGSGGGETGGSTYIVSDASGYGAPSTGYGAPDAGYGAPAASSGYDAPSDGYGAGRRRREVLTTEQKAVYADFVSPSLINSYVVDSRIPENYLPQEEALGQGVLPLLH